MTVTARSLILWRDVRISGAVFASGLVVLLALSFYSVIVVATCIAIPCVVVTLAVRALYLAKCALLKQPTENPFQHWLDEGWEIGGDRMDSINRKVANIANTIVLEMKRILLVEDLVDTIRGLLFLYLWYYIGRNISGLTLLFLGFIGVFTIPKVYDMYRREIDNAVKQIRVKYDNTCARIVENIPGMSKTHSASKTNGVHKKDEEKVAKTNEEKPDKQE